MHALRNVTSKLPERHHRELKARWWQVFDDATSAADARRGLEAIVADYRAAYPSAMAVITDNLDALVAHLRWPTEHRKRIRSTDENVKRASGRRGRVSGDGSVAAVVQRASDRLYRRRVGCRAPFRAGFGVVELSSLCDAMWRAGVGGR